MSMQHYIPMGKGDPLCPLGFHPQVRWPTRCKRCFRDYKEHGGKRKEPEVARPRKKDEITASSPSLPNRRSWSSSSTLDHDKDAEVTTTVTFKRPSSWTSTPDLAKLEDDAEASIPTVSLTLPFKRNVSVDTGQARDNKIIGNDTKASKRSGLTSTVFSKSDSLAVRAKKLQAAKGVPKSEAPTRRIHNEIRAEREDTPVADHDVQFHIKLRTKSTKREDVSHRDSLELADDDDAISLAGTDTTESTTLVDANEYDLKKQMETMRQELEATRTKCERLEKEKSNILLRRLTAMDTAKGNTSEVLKLQQKVNELQSQLDDHKDERKSLNLKVKELEDDLDNRPAPQATQKTIDEIKSKLLAAETLCEELMDENEDMKKELRDMEEEMEEMQDHFREDQVDEYSSLKKELEQTTKNCRILSFKLRKTERKTEQMEQEKTEFESKIKDLTNGGGIQQLDKLKQLETELSKEKELNNTLQKKLDESNAKLVKANESKLNNVSVVKRKTPMLGSLGKSASSDMKVSRESLTKGGSQDDPVQLLRDLQDSLEREADLREQLKFAEEDSETLRKKSSRLEEDNDSLVLQLKKMATTRTRPTARRVSPGRKDEKEEDASVIKLQLELNEQETGVLRKKIEELEGDNERLKKKSKELQDKVTLKATERKFVSKIDRDNVQSERVKMLENEMNEIRTKLIEKERDCERLEAEMKLTKIVKDGNGSKTSVEKIGTGEATDAVQLLKKVKQVERERDKLQKLLDKSKENSSVAFKNRKVNAPTELTTKLALKTMVNDLENEVTTILASLSNKEGEVTKLEEELIKSKTLKGAKDNTNKELEELTKKYDSLKKERAGDKMKLDELSMSLTNGEVEKEEFRLKIAKMKIEQELICNEKKQLESDVAKLKTETSFAKREIGELKERCESQRLDAERKEVELIKLRFDSDEKIKMAKELTVKAKKLTESQKKLKEAEDACNLIEKNLNEKLEQTQLNLEKERKRAADEKSSKDKLSLETETLTDKIRDLEKTVTNKNCLIESLEKDLAKERSATSVVIKSPIDKKELKALRDEVAKLKNDLTDSESLCKQSEKKMQSTEDKLKKLESDAKTDKLGFEKKIADLDSDLQKERKKLEGAKTSSEMEQKKYDTEINALRKKVKSMELTTAAGGSKKMIEERQEYQDKIDKIEKQAEKERKSYESLTAKYEVLEEEHVVTKAKLIADKEALTSQLFTTRKELERLEVEFETSKNKLQLKNEALAQENKELLKKSTNGDGDKSRYKTLFEQRQTEIGQMKKEAENVHDQMEFMRRENDELRKKLDDYEKVSKIQRNISADSSAMDKEIRELRQRLATIEKTKKSDLSECKMRYDSQISILNDEMQSQTAQVQRFKRERDTYKHMLEGAQKTIGDLKSNPSLKTKENRYSLSSLDDAEELKSKIASLEQQISCMEDELSESRLEASKVKTELVSERSSWEVRLSEMNSRINELEEEKILSSGRTKVVGVRTRMELSWQKEREDQQRLLQETATLARDLRQTLFEVERERDKEVLEGKRKLEQLKKGMEEEQTDSRRKLTELQGDFMELRDAHAKLRTTNEKLRREKERHERDRDEMKMMINERKRSEQDDLRRIHILVQQVENLLQVAPELFGNRERSEPPYTPTPPKRTRSKSREGSPAMERKDFSRESSVAREEKRAQIQGTLQRLVDATDELRKVQERDRIKRMHLRRATSSEKEAFVGSNGSVERRKLSRVDGSNLHRKSLSLEHTATMQERNIWKAGDDDSVSSLQSLDMNSDLDFSAGRFKRDASLDSRLSTGSAHSEVAGEKKKKSSLMGKLKKLTKSRSIDDNDDSHFSPSRQLTAKAPSNSSDVGDEAKGSKKDLKERITGMFKRSGSQSRGNSVERQIVKHDTSSTQRPLMRNGNSSGSNTNSSTDKVSSTRITTR